MFPHERSLVKQFADKPFVLLGVNGDDEDPKLKEKNEKAQITWRSFKNVGTRKAAIADEWAVEGWPTLYLIDHKGVIRHKWLGSPGEKTIDEAIEMLVKEAEQDQRKK
jgi:peroxiredoxin